MTKYTKLPPNLTMDTIMKAISRRDTALDNPGFCLNCGAEHFECEPDARNYACEECGTNAVFGAEEILKASLGLVCLITCY